MHICPSWERDPYMGGLMMFEGQGWKYKGTCGMQRGTSMQKVTERALHKILSFVHWRDTREGTLPRVLHQWGTQKGTSWHFHSWKDTQESTLLRFLHQKCTREDTSQGFLHRKDTPEEGRAPERTLSHILSAGRAPEKALYWVFFSTRAPVRALYHVLSRVLF